MRRRHLTAATLVVTAALSIGCDRGSHPDRLGRVAPTFAITDGVQSLDLSKLRGKVVVLNLWATWCAPCIEELPSLLALQHQMPDLAVVGISMDQDDDVYRSFLKSTTSTSAPSATPTPASTRSTEPPRSPKPTSSIATASSAASSSAPRPGPAPRSAISESSSNKSSVFGRVTQCACPTLAKGGKNVVPAVIYLRCLSGLSPSDAWMSHCSIPTAIIIPI